MTLEKFARLKKFIKISAVCRAVGLNFDSFNSRVLRGSPELTAAEQKTFENIFDKIIDEIKK